MVTPPFARRFACVAIVLIVAGLIVSPAVAQDGSVLTTLENQVVSAAKGW